MLAALGLSALVAVGMPYGEFLVRGVRFGVSSSTPGAFFVLFLVLVGVQPLLGRLRRSWMLTRLELLLATVMMMLVSAVATRGFTGVFVGIAAAPYYYATPENAWSEKIHPHLPSWIVPADAAALSGFFEGLPEGSPVPWGAWLLPLASWLVLMAALYASLVCAMVVLRRQWMDHERLQYPLTQLPLGMTEDPAGPSRWMPFLRNPVMWLGFAVPFVIHCFNVYSRHSDGTAAFSLVGGSLPLLRGTAVVSIKINYLVLGLAYLVNTGVAFSMWFFTLLARIQAGALSILGVRVDVQLDSASYRGPVSSIMSFEAMGAMTVLVLLGLWTARSHLRQVWVQAWRGQGPESDELLTCRAALAGLGLSLAVVAAWLWLAGLPPWGVAMFLFGCFVVYLALTRVIVEAGIVSALQGLNGAGFTLAGMGSSALGARGLLGLGFTMPWAGDHMVFMMAPVANGIRILHGRGGSRRRIVAMLAAAMLIGLAGSVCTTLLLGYRYGAANLDQQYFHWFAQEPYRVAALLMEDPPGPYGPAWGWMGVGGGVMGLLTLARQRLLWWPLHPIGFAVGGTWIMAHAWFSIFVAWLIKLLVLRYGGLRVYRSTRWFFLGLFLGYVCAAGLWLLIDAVTGMKSGAPGMY